MSFRRLMAPLALISVIAPTAAAADRGPSTAEERDRVVKMAQDCEKDPLTVMAKEGRWFEKWLDEVPDFTFGPEATARWCEGAAKGDLKRVLVFQYQLSGVAYQIQHQISLPKTLEEKQAIHLAALEGVLRAYESLLPRRAENRSEKMDEALALRAKGELPAFVKSLFAGKR